MSLFQEYLVNYEEKQNKRLEKSRKLQLQGEKLKEESNHFYYLAEIEKSAWNQHELEKINPIFAALYEFFKHAELTCIGLEYTPFKYCVYHKFYCTDKCLTCQIQFRRENRIESEYIFNFPLVEKTNPWTISSYPPSVENSEKFVYAHSASNYFSEDDVFLNQLRQNSQPKFKLNVPEGKCYHKYWDQSGYEYYQDSYLILPRNLFTILESTLPKMKISYTYGHGHPRYSILNPVSQHWHELK